MSLLLTPTYAFTTGQSATLVIGQTDFVSSVTALSQTGFDNPASLSFDASGNLWVADWFNCRVLMFKPPFSIGMAASLVIGQSTFTSGTPQTTQTGLASPEDLGFDPSGNLWVADWQNNRVLMFKPPFTTGMAATLVIGQADFTHNSGATTQTGISGPQGLGFDALGNLWVADTSNNRVLMFKPPFSKGMAASLVIGHKSFLWGGSATNQTGLNSPKGLRFDASGNLWVSEGNNNRVLMFKPPFSNGMAASLVIGHTSFLWGGAAINQTGLNNPNKLGFDASGSLWVADANNNRVLLFKPPFTNGMAASLVIGQVDFTHSLAATTQTGLRTSIGLGFDLIGNLWVVDDSNNRVLMFPGSTGLSGFLLEFQAGWNLISLPLVPTKTAIKQLLLPLIQLNELVVVWSYTPGASTAWSSFTAPGPATCTSSATQLCVMVDGKGYWVRVNDAINITIAGYVIPPLTPPPTYSLAAGWNLAGFKPQPNIQNETVSQYLNSINTKYSTVWVYDNLNATWIRATPDLELAPGEGMWIYMTTPATLLP